MVFIKLTYCTTYLTAVWQLHYPLCGHAIKAQCVYAAPALYTKQRRTRKQQQQEGQQGWQGRLTHHPKKVKVPNEMKAHLLFGLGSSVMDNMMIGCNYYAWAAGQESIRSSYLYNTYISDREKNDHSHCSPVDNRTEQDYRTYRTGSVSGSIFIWNTELDHSDKTRGLRANLSPRFTYKLLKLGGIF